MKVRINFASREYILAWKVYASMLAVLALGCLLFFYGYAGYRTDAAKVAGLSARTAREEKRVSELKARIESLRKTVDEAEVKEAVQQAQFANQAIARRVFSWTTFLNRLEEVVPDGVGISSISPDFESLNVSISGTALGMGQVTEFVRRLTASPYFEDIPPTFHVSETLVDKDIGKTLYPFNLQIHYNPRGRKGGE